MAPTSPFASEISVYWQPGCSSCLRTKEFLAKHDVPFRSRNVLDDTEAFEELAKLGIRRVPTVVRGERWADGQILRDVAELCGIGLADQAKVTPTDLADRVLMILDSTIQHARQMPADRLLDEVPNRPRSYADLIYHVINIVDAYVEHEHGKPLVYEDYFRTPDKDIQTPEGLALYGEQVKQAVSKVFLGYGETTDWGLKANVYYGDQTIHEFLERTTWHSAQHARQVAWILENLGITPVAPLSPELLANLPMPENIWDRPED